MGRYERKGRPDPAWVVSAIGLGVNLPINRGRESADAASMNAAGANFDLGSQISVAVARKSLDNVERQGEALVGMIADAAAISEQSRGAVSAVPGPGETGLTLDVTA